MVHLAEATEMQIVARLAGVLMSALGATFFLVFLVMRGVDGEARERGDLEVAARVKRNVLITLGLGVLLLGGGAALYFSS
ncbi:hypothetical protein ACH4JZ_13395 [Streptomyces sp. NPDC017615]|uniref:hypothetical protein n=1 Tax=Streptomyces sp. NPDC017615 TaxID=3365003 RepID=UPI0037B8BEE3